MTAVLPAKLVHQVPDGGWYMVLDVSEHVPDSYAVAVAPELGLFPAGHQLERRLTRISLCGERTATLTGVARLVDCLRGRS